MTNTILLTGLLTAGGAVLLVRLTFVIFRLVGRRRILHNLGVVSQRWLTAHRVER
jgi:hypothetical protein